MTIALSGYRDPGAGCKSGQAEPEQVWVGTWSTAPQLVEPHNMPPAPGLTFNILRQVVRVSIGGDSLRVRFSNEFSTNPVTLQSVEVALSRGGSSVDPATGMELRFNHEPGVTMKPGETVTSDACRFALGPRADLAITIRFGATSPDVTGHPGSRTTSYILPGSEPAGEDFTGAITTDHWYVISGIEVKAPASSAAVVILGNSITDGRGSGTNKQNRWPDILSERLLENPATSHVAVLNQGIGGNCVIRNCLGPSALDRFDRDVLSQQGVRWLIIMEGINDIGQTQDSASALLVADGLVAAFAGMADEAHAKGIRVYGATLLPFGKSFYYADFRETARNKVNEWIRHSKSFDAVIDFEKALVNPEEPLTILPGMHTGDYLHPNEEGYRLMGGAINLELFE